MTILIEYTWRTGHNFSTVSDEGLEPRNEKFKALVSDYCTRTCEDLLIHESILHKQNWGPSSIWGPKCEGCGQTRVGIYWWKHVHTQNIWIQSLNFGDTLGLQYVSLIIGVVLIVFISTINATLFFLSFIRVILFNKYISY